MVVFQSIIKTSLANTIIGWRRLVHTAVHMSTQYVPVTAHITGAHLVLWPSRKNVSCNFWGRLC